MYNPVSGSGNNPYVSTSPTLAQATPSTWALSHNITKIISESTEIPGLKAEQLQQLRPQLLSYWNQLVQSGELVISDTDEKIRPYFVTLQAVTEHVLACELGKQVLSLKGIIHTPAPATPLCTKDNLSSNLVDPSIENDQKRLLTVKARVTILREYLQKSGQLYVLYPKNGIHTRTEEQQKIYKNELQEHSKVLFDRPLDIETLPDEMSGATYFFQDKEGKTGIFAIKMTQANKLKPEGHFGLWYGDIHHPSISSRVHSLKEFIKQSNPELITELQMQ